MLKTATIFQNGMVLQREKNVTIWGAGTPGQQVFAAIQGKEGSTIVAQNGDWQIVLEPLKTSEYETLVVKCGDETLIFEDVAVGEVWLAGGQSNMEFQMRYEKHYYAGDKPKDNSKIRFYDVAEVCFDGQKEAFDYSAQEIWRKAEGKDLEYFSAVAYYFAGELHEVMDIPVGIVGCNWGGTRSCAWMNPETVEKVGKAWMDDYRNQISGMDMDVYWKEQLANPMNNRGNLFDEFSEFFMPATPTPEEIMAHMKEMGIDPESFGENMPMQPQTVPGCLYEHMVKTVAPYAIRGFIWYQGESDDEEGKQILYKDMLSGMIGDWRNLWHDTELPFLLVQLPGFDHWLGGFPSHYDIIRQCQQEVAETVPLAYACCISDAGEEADIHPKNKKVVGHRLALLARNYVYGQRVDCEAPIFKSVKRCNDQIIITFDYAYNGLQMGSKDAVSYGVAEQSKDTIANLNVYAADEEVAYTAKIDKDKVILSLEAIVDGPLCIEFASGNWFLVNLYNSAGIPAKPFKVCC